MSSPTVTIIIPTCNRPQYLSEALESVQCQTARQQIGQVIVSENGGTDDSRQVCVRFPELPILYLQQRPPVPIMDHLKVIWPHVTEPLVAILHDDDWWEPEHLEKSVKILHSDPDCAAVYSSLWYTEGAQHPRREATMAFVVWLATGCDFRRSVLTLTQEQVTLACLIGTAFHYSTVVGKAGAIYDAYCKIRDASNLFDNDRTFPIFLTTHGHLAYLTQPTAYVRIHEQQDVKRYRETAHSRMAVTTRFISKTWPDWVGSAIAHFNRVADNLDPFDLAICTHHIQGENRECLIEECGLNFGPPTSESRNWQWFIQQLCPPCFYIMLKRATWYLRYLQNPQLFLTVVQAIFHSRRSQGKKPVTGVVP